MTFNPNLPLASDKIRIFPGDVTTNNWPRLKTIIDADHQFNNSALPNDGYHKVAHFVTQLGLPGTATPAPVTGIGETYTRSVDNTFFSGGTTTEHLYYQPGTNPTKWGELAISPWTVRAAVVFDGSSGTAVIKSTYNMATVVRSGLGEWIFTFGAIGTPAPLVNNNYSVQICAETSGSNGCVGYIIGGTYGDHHTTSAIGIQFRTLTNSAVDPTYASVVVMGGYLGP